MIATYITRKNFIKLCQGVSILDIAKIVKKLNIVVIEGGDSNGC